MSREMCPKSFQERFDAYFRRWNIGVSILFVVAFSLFFVPMLVRATNSELPPFIRSMVNFGFSTEIGIETFGFITIGIIAVGIVTVGVIAVGPCSIGVLAFGAGSVGIFAFGGNAIGVIALGAGSRYGAIDKWSAPRGRFNIGRAVGLVAMGPTAHGRYTLSYAGKGRYVFSPNRQDEEAVALFTRWLPKFSDVFSPSSAVPKSR
ncbi:MAG: hypothetical protein OXP71_13925 [Candidatus Poribacteria bacterium]|nr:hypothetical protein [Candidatus Poribacteria bacterium]